MRFMTKATRTLATVGAVVTACTLAGPSPVGGAEQLTFAQIRTIVEKNLKANPRYRPGDLIVRCDVEPIFNELISLGFVPADTEELYDAFLPDMAPLIQQLRSDAGRKFMQDIRDIEGAYDRLERLSWLPGGPAALLQLIRAKDGVEKLKVLTTSSGTAAIRKQFPEDPRAQNFDRPTGHIHTADALLKHLEQIHRDRTAAR
jgi:hypothetical protein